MEKARGGRWGFVLGLVLLYLIGLAALAAGAVWPEAPGTVTYSKGDLQVDASHAADGYVMARGPNSKARLKLRVSKGEAQLLYDLNGGGQYETIPLQMGSGDYTFSLFKNVSGNKYSQEGSLKFSVSLSSESAPFLAPNQYVPYTADSEAVKISQEICEGLSADLEKVEAVRDYIRSNFVYDYVKAATIQSGVMPDIDGLLQKKMGICQDLSALMACMLRVQGIPTQLVIGYADKNYHAWNNVMIDGEYRRVDMTAEINAISRDVTYTVERFY